MLTIRRSQERGHANHGWLDSYHTFSFANYYDPKHIGFRSLRVINEDHIAGGMGFGAHPHKDMEIITYIISGKLEHQDSMGNKEAISPGEIQRMSAGTGVVHSEYNPHKTETTHLLQIWILPNKSGNKPAYEQKMFEESLNSQDITLVVSQNSREGSIGITQDVDLYVSRLKKEKVITFPVRPTRGVWIQLIKGIIIINGQTLVAGDAASTQTAGDLTIEAQADSEFMIFDLV